MVLRVLRWRFGQGGAIDLLVAQIILLWSAAPLAATVGLRWLAAAGQPEYCQTPSQPPFLLHGQPGYREVSQALEQKQVAMQAGAPWRVERDLILELSGLLKIEGQHTSVYFSHEGSSHETHNVTMRLYRFRWTSMKHGILIHREDKSSMMGV